MKNFENKNVIITGGTAGIGFATTQAFLNEGAQVWITGRSLETLQKIKNEINNDKLNIIVSNTSNLARINLLDNEIKKKILK